MSLIAAFGVEAAEPIIYVVDARRESQPPPPSANYGLVGVWIANMAQRGMDRKATEMAAEFYDALSFDVLDAAMESIPVPSAFAAAPADVAALRESSAEALAKLLQERGAEQGVLVHYLAVPDLRFWAQLRVERVKTVDGTLTSEPLATAYYIAGLAKEDRHGRDGWSELTLPRLERELRASFVELTEMWARIAADADAAGDPQPAWESLPVLPKEQDDWEFHCRGAAQCKHQRLVQLTSSRAWMTGPDGAVLASIDKWTAGRAPNFLIIQMAVGVP